MKKFIGIAAAVITVITSISTQAFATELITPAVEETQVETEVENAAAESSVMDMTPKAYFTDKDWADYYGKIKKDHMQHLDSGLYDLYILIISRQLSYEQLHEVLEDGFFHEYIDEWKARGILESDYKLPDGVVKQDFKINRVERTEVKTYEDDNSWQNHYVDNLSSHETDEKIVGYTNDQFLNNAFVIIKASAEDKTLNGEMVEFSALAGEPLQVYVMDETDDHTLYAWDFSQVVYFRKQYLDLTVDFNGAELNYDLKDTIPYPAKLTLYTGKDNGFVMELKDEKGNIAMSLPVDERGYVELEVTKDGHYKTSYKEITIADSSSQESSEIAATEKAVKPAPKEVSNIPILIFVLVICTLGMIFFVLAFTTKIDSKKKRK